MELQLEVTVKNCSARYLIMNERRDWKGSWRKRKLLKINNYIWVGKELRKRGSGDKLWKQKSVLYFCLEDLDVRKRTRAGLKAKCELI